MGQKIVGFMTHPWPFPLSLSFSWVVMCVISIITVKLEPFWLSGLCLRGGGG